LQGIARAYVQFAQEHPWLMREMFSGLTIEHEAFPNLYTTSKTVFTLYVEVVNWGQERGVLLKVIRARLPVFCGCCCTKWLCSRLKIKCVHIPMGPMAQKV
jgi:hypothetical protein